MPKQVKTSKSFFAERRGFVEVETLPIDVPAVTVAPRKTRKERQPIDEGDRPESRMQLRKGGEVKQLANKSINYSAFVIATLIPTAWLLSANLLQFILSGQLFLSSYRLVAVATGRELPRRQRRSLRLMPDSCRRHLSRARERSTCHPGRPPRRCSEWSPTRMSRCWPRPRSPRPRGDSR